MLKNKKISKGKLYKNVKQKTLRDHTEYNHSYFTSLFAVRSSKCLTIEYGNVLNMRKAKTMYVFIPQTVL